MKNIKSILAIFALLFFCASETQAANRFLTCMSTCTITAVDTTIWGTTSGGVGASVPGSADAVVLDAATCVGGVTCTATMGAAYNPTWQSITMGACTASTTGCILDFSVNNNNVTLSATTGFSGTGAGVRTFIMGSGTLTISNAAGNFTNTTSTNFTLTAGTSTIAFTSTAPTGTRTLNTGGLTYNAVTVAGTTTAATWGVTGGGTIASLTVSPKNNVQITSGDTLTVTTLTMSGSVSNPIILSPSTPQTTATLALTTATMTGLAIRGMTFTGSPTATNSFDVAGNSGITITAPSGGGAATGHIIGSGN